MNIISLPGETDKLIFFNRIEGHQNNHINRTLPELHKNSSRCHHNKNRNYKMAVLQTITNNITNVSVTTSTINHINNCFFL